MTKEGGASEGDKVVAGEQWNPPSERLHNAWTNAAIKTNSYDGAGGEGPQNPALLQSSDIIWVRATSPIGPFTVVGYDNPASTPANLTEAYRSIRNQFVLSQAAPGEQRWGIVQEQADVVGEVVPVVASGFTWAQVDVIDLNHKYVEWDGSKLASAESGFAWIRDTAFSTGVQWLFLQLGCCGSASATDPNAATKSCVCSLITTLENNGTLNATEAADLRDDCDCWASVTCSNCTNQKMPEEVVVTLANYTISYSQPVDDPGAANTALSAYINQAHTFTMFQGNEGLGYVGTPIITGCKGGLEQDFSFPAGAGSIEDRVRLILSREATPDRWRISVHIVNDGGSAYSGMADMEMTIAAGDCTNPASEGDSAGASSIGPALVDFTEPGATTDIVPTVT